MGEYGKAGMRKAVARRKNRLCRRPDVIRPCIGPIPNIEHLVARPPILRPHNLLPLGASFGLCHTVGFKCWVFSILKGFGKYRCAVRPYSAVCRMLQWKFCI